MYVLCIYVDFSYIPVAFSVGDIVVVVGTSVVGIVVDVLLVVSILVELVGSGVAVGGISVCSNILYITLTLT